MLERAKQRIEAARADRGTSSRFEAALERSRAEVESLTRTAAELEATLPDRVTAAVQDGLSREVAVITRSLAELRGLLNQAIHRLERLEQELLAERQARLDDLSLLVDLVASGWQGVDARLERLESGGAEVVQLRGDREHEHAAIA